MLISIFVVNVQYIIAIDLTWIQLENVIGWFSL